MARQIWLLRHGEAEPHGTRPDPERRLTTRGESQSRAAGRAIVALGDDFGAVLSSPRVRALDTARLAAGTWGGEPQVHEPLSSGFGARDALEALRSSGGERVLLVGHEPDLSNIVAELTGARIDLKKGGLVIVRLEGGSGEVVSLLRPRELAAIAGDDET
jgi:phosphohistidine phosphatase